MVTKVFYASSRDITPCKYTIQDIAEWHEKTFPLASTMDQKRKFNEEAQEWHDSHDISELADMFIVACGMTRFPVLDAQIAFHTINEICLLNSITSKTLLDAVDKKMAINEQRKWNRSANGDYRHIG